jgi:mono/diheme cytochrome c family protein
MRPGAGSAFVVSLAVSIGAAAPQSPPSGAGTAAQARRGEVVYLRVCERCHMVDLRGDSAEEIPALAADEFLARWRERTAADLFLKISRTMPASAPATLAPRDAADLVAYLLQANGLRAGGEELPAEADLLRPIRIEPNR